MGRTFKKGTADSLCCTVETHHTVGQLYSNKNFLKRKKSELKYIWHIKSFKNFRERRCEHYYFYFLLFLCNKTTHFSRRNSAKYIFKKVNSDRIFCYEQINKIGMCLFAKWVSLWFNKDLGGKVLTLELGIEMFEYQVQPFPKKNFTGLCYVK